MRSRPALFAIAFAVATAACAEETDPPPPTGPLAVSVERYHYRLDLASRRATVTITASVETAGDCLELPFRAMALDTTTVRIDGVAAAFTAASGGIFTVCGRGYPVGDVLDIDATMTIPPQPPTRASDVGLSTFSDQWGNEHHYLVSWVGGCDEFGPCDTRPDQFARYTFEVTHPAGMTVRCPGLITPGPTMTTCDFAFAGGPTYSTFGLIASTNWTTTALDFSGIAVELYDRPMTGIAAGITAAYHGGFIDFMRGHFGAYPYGTQLRLLTAPTYWAGFEHPGNIVLSDSLAGPSFPGGYADPLAHTLNHEIAHQWAGDQTTLAGTYDFVWKEAMVEYLTHVYEDMTAPSVGAATRNYWKRASAGARYFSVPDERPALFDYYGDVYGPGPFVLFHQIEKLSSRAQVLTALEGLLGSPRALSVLEVEAALATATGLDLDGYFAAWAHGSGAPVWPEFTATYSATTGMLTVTQTNQGAELLGCKFAVTLRSAAGELTTVDVDTFRNGPDQQLAVTPGFVVTQTFIDLNNDCLAYPTGANLTAQPRVHPWLAR